MIRTDFLNLAPHDSANDRQARQRAADVFHEAGTRNSRGPRIDFSKPSPPAAKSSGMGGSMLDAYAPAFRAEVADRDERNARLDRLPAAVARLAQSEGVTSVELLEAVAIIERNCNTMGGEAQVFSSDVGRTIGVTARCAEELLREATAKGFIEPRANHYWRCKL